MLRKNLFSYPIAMISDVVPSAPRGFSVMTIENSSSTLLASWMEPEMINGILLSYTVRCVSTGDLVGEMHNFTISNTFSNTELGGLTPYTDYSCTISATTGAGEGNSSDAQTARTDEDGMKIYIIW